MFPIIICNFTFLIANAVSKDSQLTDSLDQHGSVAERPHHVICRHRWSNLVHDNVGVLLWCSHYCVEESWDVGTVNVVAASLALRLDNEPLGALPDSLDRLENYRAIFLEAWIGTNALTRS